MYTGQFLGIVYNIASSRPKIPGGGGGGGGGGLPYGREGDVRRKF